MTAVISILMGAYLLLALAAFLMQRVLMYPAPRESAVLNLPGGQLVSLVGPTSRGVHAYYVSAHGQNPTVVVFHGNAEQLADQRSLIESLSAAGLGAYVVEYPGYGLSRASRTTEASIYEDAGLTLLHLEQHFGVSRERVVLYGRSLGTGIAVEMAKRGFGRAIILLSPYTSMVEMAHAMAPILPTQWLVLDRFDSLAKAPQIRQPTLVVHGAKDSVIPCEMGRRLASSLPSATFVVIDDANHNDLLDVGGLTLLRRIVGFATAIDSAR